MTRPVLPLALLSAVALIHLVTAGTQFDVERGELRELSSEIEGLKLRLIRDLRNKDLTLNVTALEASVVTILDMIANLTAKVDAITTKVDANAAKADANTAKVNANTVKLDANTAAIANKCDTATCTAIQASVTKHDTCFGDVSSTDCPSAASGKTGVAAGITANTAALATKCDLSKCGTMETKVTNAEGCLADTSSSTCPSAPSGKVSVPAAITALEKPPLFNCDFLGGNVNVNTDILKPYTCDVNVGNVVSAADGKFTVAKAGKYRLTFMALCKPKNRKKVITILVLDKGAAGEKAMARSVAQSKIGTEEEQVTTTIDIVWELAVGNTVSVQITVGSADALISGSNSYPRQVVFTGEYIGA